MVCSLNYFLSSLYSSAYAQIQTQMNIFSIVFQYTSDTCDNFYSFGTFILLIRFVTSNWILPIGKNFLFMSMT